MITSRWRSYRPKGPIDPAFSRNSKPPPLGGGVFTRPSFLHARKPGEDRLVGIDIEAGSENNILAPVHNGEIALGVHFLDVAGKQPVIAQEISDFARLLPVAGHDLRHARDNFTGLADRDLVSVVVDTFS